MDTSREEFIRMESLNVDSRSEKQHDQVDLDNIDIDPRLERRIKMKLDITILPMLVSIQFLSQMAKSDLGNAKVAGLMEEMDMSPTDYSHTASMLLVGYVLFQIPGTMLIRVLGPPYQFGGAIVLWGVFTTCIVAAQTIGALQALRFLTGASEAFIHGTLLYLSFWYRYDELATRGAFFTATAALAGAFNGLISHGIQKNLAGVNGWRPWRWIFLIEGIIPLVWGFVVMALLPSTPETIRGVFSPAEKQIVLARSRAAHNTGDSKIRPAAMWQVLKDPTFWMFVAIDCGVHFTEGTLPNFIPSILAGIGWEGDQAQIMSSIVYACAFVSIMTWARIADKTGHRGIPLIINCCVAFIGFILLQVLTAPVPRLVAACIVAVGAYPCVLLVIVWMALSTPGYSHRSSSVAFINTAAQLFGIIGNEVYIDPPLYHTGLSVSMSLLAMSAVVAAVLLWRLRLLNRKKEAERDSQEATNLREKTIDEIGNRHPDFMYRY